ncbi:MAG TPA: nicotinamide riboside transporter PnuC [Bacteroidia bacterium]|nr:nicotinamide riboside transporter PnuC [Bacteroidia bacterium]
MEFDLAGFILDQWTGIVVFLLGAAGVWLTIRENIWCWPVSLVAVVISIVIFFDSRLYGDMALQIFYFFAGLYGWFYWNSNKNKAFVVQRAKLKEAPALIGITVLQVLLYYYLLLRFKGEQPLFDAILTAGSLTVTYMMTKKWLENWLIWVVIDVAYILLYCIKELWFFAALSLIMAILAAYGYFKWRKTV